MREWSGESQVLVFFWVRPFTMHAPYIFATIWTISLEFYRKPSILAADDFLGACYRKAMTPKKAMHFTFSPSDPRPPTYNMWNMNQNLDKVWPEMLQNKANLSSFGTKSGQNLTRNASKPFGAIFLFMLLPCMWGLGFQNDSPLSSGRMVVSGWPRVGSVWLRFVHGTVRTVPGFVGSDGSCVKRVSLCFRDRKSTPKNLYDKDFAELSAAFCLKTLDLLGSTLELFRKFFGTVRAIFWPWGSFLVLKCFLLECWQRGTALVPVAVPVRFSNNPVVQSSPLLVALRFWDCLASFSLHCNPIALYRPQIGPPAWNGKKMVPKNGFFSPPPPPGKRRKMAKKWENGHFWPVFPADFPICQPFFPLFPGGAKTHFSAIFSHFGPEARNSFCTGQSGSESLQGVPCLFMRFSLLLYGFQGFVTPLSSLSLVFTLSARKSLNLPRIYCTKNPWKVQRKHRNITKEAPCLNSPRNSEQPKRKGRVGVKKILAFLEVFPAFYQTKPRKPPFFLFAYFCFPLFFSLSTLPSPGNFLPQNPFFLGPQMYHRGQKWLQKTSLQK